MIAYLRNGFRKFIAMESASSVLLFGATVLALFLANSNLSETYFHFLEEHLTIELGEFSLSKTIIHWINDGLMVIFFYVVGLEIKRELVAGELSSLQQSAFPVIAALGGMVIPAAIFLSFNPTGIESNGWGIPMATDIAFSLGILQLLGKRVPLGLKVFLTAFAIIDDLGAVLIIAFFYSSNIMLKYLLISLIIYVVLILMNVFKVNIKLVFILAGVVIWYLFLKSGVHPTIAGVLIALVTPTTRKIGKLTFSSRMKTIINEFEGLRASRVFLNKPQLDSIEHAETLINDVQPELQRYEHKLHGWVAFFIMPVFALANAGVAINFGEGGGIQPLAFHVGLALLAGKVIGITGFSWIAVKLKLAKLPFNTNFKHIFGISFLGGVGFTMALFINSLAYEDRTLIDSAKIGIIGASVVAGIIGYFLLKWVINQDDKKPSPVQEPRA